MVDDYNQKFLKWTSSVEDFSKAIIQLAKTAEPFSFAYKSCADEEKSYDNAELDFTIRVPTTYSILRNLVLDACNKLKLKANKKLDSSKLNKSLEDFNKLLLSHIKQEVQQRKNFQLETERFPNLAIL